MDSICAQRQAFFKYLKSKKTSTEKEVVEGENTPRSFWNEENIQKDEIIINVQHTAVWVSPLTGQDSAAFPHDNA